FSSGRRHTSFSRDWSSDVCSSDLADVRLGRVTQREERAGQLVGVQHAQHVGLVLGHVDGPVQLAAHPVALGNLGDLCVVPGRDQIGRASCRESEYNSVKTEVTYLY